MRCPKCHYLSFDPEPRCKNCGYDLEVPDADLALRTSVAADEPMPDLTLRSKPSADELPVTLELVHAGSAKKRAAPRRRSKPIAAPEPERTTELGLEYAADPVYEEPVFRIDAEVTEVAEVAEPAEVAKVVKVAAVPGDAPMSMVDDIADELEELTAGGNDAERAPEVNIEPEPEVAAAPRLALVEDPTERQAPPAPRTPFRSPHTTADLPLFVRGIANRDDLIDEDEAPSRMFPEAPAVPAAPRPPLAVRRTAPELARSRSKPADRPLGPLDRDLLEDLRRVEREEAVRAKSEVIEERPVAEANADGRVDPLYRVAAASVDVAVLGGLAAFVFWATLRLCNVGLWDLGTNALVPLLGFLALMDLGYLLMFTAAGGQTFGKMLLGIRVVDENAPADVESHLPLRQAAFRALLTFVSVITLGLSWLPALFGRGLTLHDRIAHTRVVRA